MFNVFLSCQENYFQKRGKMEETISQSLDQVKEPPHKKPAHPGQVKVALGGSGVLKATKTIPIGDSVTQHHLPTLSPIQEEINTTMSKNIPIINKPFTVGGDNTNSFPEDVTMVPAKVCVFSIFWFDYLFYFTCVCMYVLSLSLFQEDVKEFIPKASYYAGPMLSNTLFLCKDCRDFLGETDVIYDKDQHALFAIKMCTHCQALNRGVRNQYRNTMFP